ncbi:sodium:solute symporter [Actinoalloteichus hymeniacidonis]|uniref:SSS sodium solute transporter n=1 Tax=Actinoalloteichus hymeniacidonis TaxID=340345 RepID=A0AAC9HUK9_9PSEU|nr:sodium:solute symporter [Actinoalloteichus hymeniacidonis]AOS65241.1 SSS sodium solute transporter [Actinoalloteichus hymeniacidonis]MBB5906678.1 SSS family transporter [Actinoalloteichus hymeniacidonis]
MHTLDLIVIVGYLVLMPVLGVLLAGRQKSAEDYFVGGRNLPWWAVCFSVVATETSTLTVISVPTVAYLGSFTYLQLAIGYLIGRVVVAFVLLPRYYAGNLVSAYAFLGKRFGRGLQGTASVTFLVTRLLADGVRLFATAIPVKLLLDAFGLNVAYWQIILGLSLFTVIYTYVGGIKAVVWVDVVQMAIYVGGGVAAVWLLANRLPDGWVGSAAEAGKFQLLDFGSSILTNQYSFITAVIGGAIFAMASHGADQLMVQRLLACRNVRDSQKALIASGFVVFLQFAVFLVVGAMLWSFYGGMDPAALGLGNNDELFPTFIIEEFPPGLAGLMIAGILAAAMSTLSSSLNSLSTSTVSDLYQRFTRRTLSDEAVLRYGRIWTVVWALVFVGFASLFTTTSNPVVEVGLSIASYTYGALLGAFALGLLVRRANQVDAIVAFASTIVVVLLVMTFVRFPGADGEPTVLAFPWFAPLGVAVTMLVGWLMSLRRPRPGVITEDFIPRDAGPRDATPPESKPAGAGPSGAGIEKSGPTDTDPSGRPDPVSER